MNSPAYELARYLETQGVGVWATQSELVWALGVDIEPDKPDRAVTLHDGEGGMPDTDQLDLQEFQIDVRVRGGRKGNDVYLEAYRKADEIRDKLILPMPIILGDGTYVTGIRMVGTFSSLGRDDTDRPILMASFMAQIDRSNSTS